MVFVADGVLSAGGSGVFFGGRFNVVAVVVEYHGKFLGEVYKGVPRNPMEELSPSGTKYTASPWPKFSHRTRNMTPHVLPSTLTSLPETPAACWKLVILLFKR